jgi:hypothetical protein
MNPSILLFVSLFTIGLQIQSCKDDDIPLVTSDALEGNWTAVSYTATETYYFFTGGQVATYGHSVEGFDLDYEVSFQEDTYTCAGSYGLDIWTVDNNGSLSGNDSLFQNGVLIAGGYLATENTLEVDSMFFKLTLEPFDTTEAPVEQSIDYEINATDTELIINRYVVYLKNFDSGAFKRITSNSTSTWRRL